MRCSPAFTAAFTLIEVMLSIALGSMIVLTAFAGFRVAAQAVTAANRLSIENSLMRAGYFEAQRQVDYWTQYDDPDQPPIARVQTGTIVGVGKRRNGDTKGFPFTPVQELNQATIGPGRNWKVWPQSNNVPRNGSPTRQAVSLKGAAINEILPRPIESYQNLKIDDLDEWEQDTGWDSTYSWAPHDPRTWDRTNLKEKVQSVRGYCPNPLPPSKLNARSDWDRKTHIEDTTPPLWYGRYAIFSQFNESAWKNPGLVGAGSNALLTPWRIVEDPNVNSLLNVAFPLIPPTPQNPIDGTLLITYDNYDNNEALPHHWLPRQKSAFFGAYGYAAILEYMPPNVSYAVYSDYVNNVFSYPPPKKERSYIKPPDNKFPPELNPPDLPANRAYCGLDKVGFAQQGVPSSNDISKDWGPLFAGQNGFGYAKGLALGTFNLAGQFATSAYSNTSFYTFGFINQRARYVDGAQSPSFLGNLARLNSDIFNGYSTEYAETGPAAVEKYYHSSVLLEQSGLREPLMAAQPVQWPFVQVSVARYIKNAHHIALSKIRMLSPITGKEIEMSWGGIGTSLRGARQQRKGGNISTLSGSGWAKWDNDRNSVNDIHLDQY